MFCGEEMWVPHGAHVYKWHHLLMSISLGGSCSISVFKYRFWFHSAVYAKWSLYQRLSMGEAIYNTAQNVWYCYIAFYSSTQIYYVSHLSNMWGIRFSCWYLWRTLNIDSNEILFNLQDAWKLFLIYKFFLNETQHQTRVPSHDTCLYKFLWKPNK